jgi:transketolase
MGAIANGLAYDGLFIPFTATFLQFADYMRPTIRLAALAKLQSIYVFTHDSIFLGEDGPTHQPVEHLTALRCIPNLHVVRPVDGEEVAVGWAHALTRREGPTALIFTRQKFAAVTRDGGFDAARAARGGYAVNAPAGATFGWSPCRACSASTPSRKPGATRCCRPGCPSPRSRRPPASSGGATPARTAW